MMVQVDADELAALRAELVRLQAREQHLVQRGNEMTGELRRVDRRRMVREGFYAFGQERTMADRPHIPSEELVRFSVRLVAEEFLEFIEATFSCELDPTWQLFKDEFMRLVNEHPLRIRLADMVDATVDLDYVVEGLRIRFGVNSTVVWAEVQRANLAKAGGPIRPSDGKRLKPPGWTPPDIAGVLRKLGWTDAGEACAALTGPPCPQCGAGLVQGFGLAGGGYGAYEYCVEEGCDYFTKSQEFPEDELPTSMGREG